MHASSCLRRKVKVVLRATAASHTKDRCATAASSFGSEQCAAQKGVSRQAGRNKLGCGAQRRPVAAFALLAPVRANAAGHGVGGSPPTAPSRSALELARQRHQAREVGIVRIFEMVECIRLRKDAVYITVQNTVFHYILCNIYKLEFEIDETTYERKIIADK